MSEQRERTNEQTGEWPNTLRVDFKAIYPTSHLRWGSMRRSCMGARDEESTPVPPTDIPRQLA